MRQEPRFEHTALEVGPIRAGTEVTLIKRAVFGETSVQVGQEMRGKLATDIEVGSSVEIPGAGRTSTVRKIYRHNGRIYIDTRTSQYEVILDGANHHKKHHEITHADTLSFQNEFGKVERPADAIEASLGNDVIDKTWTDGGTGKTLRVHINKPALQGVLLEVHGGEIFKAVGGRLMVLAKVGNIHLPFYISSKGTSGKREGEWYPFFGYTGEWLVKGEITGQNGEMEYHPEISKVQNILNENLIIPTRVLSPKGKIGTGRAHDGVEPANILFDLGRHLKYQNSLFTEFGAKDDYDEAFVHRITGYLPLHVQNGDPSAMRWIREVVSRIR